VLEVELYDDNFPYDALLGKTTITCKKFIENPLKPSTAYYQLHVYKFGQGYVKTANVKLTLSFQHSYEGVAVFTLVDGRNLANRGGMMGKQDPYCLIKLGKKNSKRSRTIDDGGTNPSFQNEQILMHVPRDGFEDDVEIKLYDDDVGFDDVIGKCTFSILPYIRDAALYRSKKTKQATPPPVQSFSLTHKNKMCGELRMSVQFLPAGSLRVDVVRARKLRNPDRNGEPDPYVTLTMESIVPQLRQEYKTLVHDDGGADSIWNATFNFDFVDQVELDVKVWDEDFGRDDLIGFTTINIVDIVRELGTAEGWYEIEYKHKGKLKPAGELFLKFTFDGYDKIRYPQYRPTLDGSDRVIDSIVEEKGVLKFNDLPANLAYDPLLMTQGRLHLTFDRARKMTYPDKKQLNHMPWIYGKVFLGSSGKAPLRWRTKPAKNCVNTIRGGKDAAGLTALFHHEKMAWDLLDVANLVGEEKNDFTLAVEIWEERMPVCPLACGCHRLLGRIKIDLLPILSNPFRPVEDWFALQEDCNEEGFGEVRLNLKYEAGRHGMIIFTLIEGKALRNTAGFFGNLVGDKMDPYVYLKFGGQTARSKTCSDGGQAPSFFNEQLLLWSGTLESGRKKGGGMADAEMWQKPLEIIVYDDDTGRDAVVGKAELDLLQYFSVEKSESNRMRKIELKKGGVEAGQLTYRLDFIPAGKLTVWVKSGRGLRETELVGSQDPYVVLEVVDSKCGKLSDKKVKTKVHNDGGRDPIFNECFEFDIVDAYEMKVRASKARNLVGCGKLCNMGSEYYDTSGHLTSFPPPAFGSSVASTRT
jgi:hypothetical protein